MSGSPRVVYGGVWCVAPTPSVFGWGWGGNGTSNQRDGMGFDAGILEAPSHRKRGNLKRRNPLQLDAVEVKSTNR